MQKTKERVNILGINVFEGTINQIIDSVKVGYESNDQITCISATSAHGLIEAKKNERFRLALNSFQIVMPDGMPLVWAGKMAGARNMNRCYGPDFFKRLLLQTSNNPSLKHFFCGGNEGVAESLKEKVAKKFDNNNVVGTYSPPFLPVQEFDYQGIGKVINESGANFLWIGLSTPKQEEFTYLLKGFVNVKYIATVGAAFDFHNDTLIQAPGWMQRNGLEWLFRLFMEPKRLWRRYLEVVPKFIYYNVKDFLSNKTGRD